MNYTIEKIATLIGARRIGTADARIRLGGEVDYADVNFLVVPSPLEALQRLAERHRDEFSCPVVGITGSNGKTMVKEWLYQVLSPDHHVTRSPKSFNSQIGVPLSVWLLNEQTEVGLFEAGISQPGEMQALADIIQPTIGVLTSIGAPHQENFRSMEEKCMEKLQLFHDAQAIIYSADDDLVSRCVRRSGFKGKRIGWRREELLKTYKLPFIDEASVECSLAVAATALYLGVTPEQLSERMARLEPVAMRLEVKEGQHGCTLINDSYNSDINSLDIALDFMSRRVNDNRRRTLILSDIFQSGMTPEELYREVNELCVKRGVSKMIGIGPQIATQAKVFALPEKLFGGNKVVEETVILYGEVEFARRKFRFFGCRFAAVARIVVCSQGASGRESPDRPAAEKSRREISVSRPDFWYNVGVLRAWATTLD